MLRAYPSRDTVVPLEFAGDSVSVIATDEFSKKQTLCTLTYFKNEWLLTRSEDVILAETRKIELKANNKEGATP